MRIYHILCECYLLDMFKLVLALLLGSLAAMPQTHQHTTPDSSPVDLAKVPAPQHLDGIGQSHIPITTKSPEAQQWFDQGLALLHCFWDYEALRSFEQAVRLDPDCAMCHWGLSQALDFNPANHEQANAELKKASELAENASDHEQRYIRAYSEQAEKHGPESEAAFTKGMESLIAHYPDDLEAKLLLAGHLISGYDSKGDPLPGMLYGQAMLRDLLHEYPQNAAANHYWIHAVEPGDHPEWALESAEKLGKLTPASGHMVHMPGHIYFRVGDYERARQVFLDALRVDRDYMDRQHVSVRDDWNYMHNLAYLIADCAEEGRYQEAREHLGTLAALPADLGNPGFFLQIGGTAIRLAMRFGNWEDVRDLASAAAAPDEKPSVWVQGYRDLTAAYARGMKAVESGQLAEAEAKSNLLDALLWRLSREDVGDKNKGIRDRVVNNLATASLELRGHIAGEQGKFDDMRKLLEDAVEREKQLGYAEPPLYSRPALESLGHAFIRAAKYADARDAFEHELHERPRSGFALYGIALAWDKEGKHGEAAKAYRTFLDAWPHADPNLPQIKAAQAYLASPAH